MLRAQVTPEWTDIFNGQLSLRDLGTCITTTTDGYVYVGGPSVGSASSYTFDFAVVKYSPSGGREWTQYYNGTANYEDIPAAVATDVQGNVFVTGASDETGEGKNYVTIKYTSAGSLDWKSSYNGPGLNDDDVPAAIAVDENGNVYITGGSAGEAGNLWADFATIKYNPFGDTLWIARFGGSSNDKATDLAIDEDGCVYVTGYADAGMPQRYNYATIKYTPDGDTAWVRYYNGTGNDDDAAYAIAVDNQGNVYVTGKSWGFFYDDYATIKYNAAGERQWVSRYNGPVNSYDKAYDLVVDEEGYVYVTGASGGTGINYDYATVCYDSGGQEQWVARYNGPDNYNDHAVKMAMDGNRNLYITGYSENAPSPFISTTDIVTVKYSYLGAEQWVHRYDSPAHYNDQPAGIAADAAGNVYVSGRVEYYQQTDGADMVTIKFAAPSGLEDTTAKPESLSIFPNPTHGEITVRGETDFDQISVYNMTGACVMHLQKDVAMRAPQLLNLRSLPAGVYFISGTNGKKLLTAKVVLLSPR